MTLATDIIIRDPVPAGALFHFCQSLLGDPATQHHGHDAGRYGNAPGQGLDAWLTVDYATDGPVTVEDEVHGDRLGCTVVRFDTAYSYRADNGAGCEDLHAWLVSEVALWLEDRGAKYEWQDEFSGRWFGSVLDVTELGDPALGALQ